MSYLLIMLCLIIFFAFLFWGLWRLGNQVSEIKYISDDISKRTMETTDLNQLKQLYQEALEIPSFEKSTHSLKHRTIEKIVTRYETTKELLKENSDE